jgi:hypothetical protein
MDRPVPAEEDCDDSTPRSTLMLAVATIWLLFLVYSFVHAPVPAVNEPHYLSKALHYWQPDWCAGDFFLESSNPHLVFYQTIGVTTQWLSFTATAIIGRLAGYLLLAFAWQRLCQACTRDVWSGVTAACVFLLFASIGNLSGEWIVGGIEGKVPSYAFAFLAISSVLQQRWPTAGLSLGLGIAFHPLVGMWTLIALGMALTLRGLQTYRTVPTHVLLLLKSRQFQMGSVLLIVFGLCGIVPAVNAISGATPGQEFAANYLQVFYRLAHHLDPMQFPATRWSGYALLAVAALLLWANNKRDWRYSLLNGFTLCGGIIALVGLLIGWGDRPIPGNVSEIPLFELRQSLLKFYPFRLIDVALPVCVAIQLAGLLSSQRLLSVIVPQRVKYSALTLALVVALWMNAGLGSVNRMSPQWERDWKAACEWIRTNTAKDSQFVTPTESWAFKWYAQRAEFIAHKDCPQDAQGIGEWNRRLRFLRVWGEDHFSETGYSREDAINLGKETGSTHILSRRFGPFDLPVIYENQTYRIYSIPQQGDQ